MNDNHPALVRARELRAEETVRREVDTVRAILTRHGIPMDEDVILDVVGYYTGMLRHDGSQRGRRLIGRCFSRAS